MSNLPATGFQGFHQFPSRRGPLAGIGGKRAAQQLYYWFRNFPRDQLLDWQIVAGLTIANLFDRAARVWCQSGEREPERRRGRMTVRARIDRAASQLLRSREIRGHD